MISTTHLYAVAFASVQPYHFKSHGYSPVLIYIQTNSVANSSIAKSSLWGLLRLAPITSVTICNYTIVISSRHVTRRLQ